MRDSKGDKIEVGDKFIYQPDSPYECVGEVFDVGGVEVIKWDDDTVISVTDFYYAPTDTKIMVKI